MMPSPSPAVQMLAVQAEGMALQLRGRAADVRLHRSTPGWTGKAATSAAREADEVASALQHAASRMDDVAAALRSHSVKVSHLYQDLSDSMKSAIKGLGQGMRL